MALPIFAEPFRRIALDTIGPLPKSRSGKQYITSFFAVDTGKNTTILHIYVFYVHGFCSSPTSGDETSVAIRNIGREPRVSCALSSNAISFTYPHFIRKTVDTHGYTAGYSIIILSLIMHLFYYSREYITSYQATKHKLIPIYSYVRTKSQNVEVPKIVCSVECPLQAFQGVVWHPHFLWILVPSGTTGDVRAMIVVFLEQPPRSVIKICTPHKFGHPRVPIFT